MENKINEYEELRSKMRIEHMQLSGQIWLVGSIVVQNLFASFLMLGLGIAYIINSRRE